jgi:hypothetical protein
MLPSHAATPGPSATASPFCTSSLAVAKSWALTARSACTAKGTTSRRTGSAAASLIVCSASGGAASPRDGSRAHASVTSAGPSGRPGSFSLTSLARSIALAGSPSSAVARASSICATTRPGSSSVAAAKRSIACASPARARVAPARSWYQGSFAALSSHFGRSAAAPAVSPWKRNDATRANATSESFTPTSCARVIASSNAMSAPPLRSPRRARSWSHSSAARGERESRSNTCERVCSAAGRSVATLVWSVSLTLPRSISACPCSFARLSRT